MTRTTLRLDGPADQWRIRNLIPVVLRSVTRYTSVVIQSFGSKDTQRVWDRTFVRRIGSELTRMAYRKLQAVDAAQELSDLRVPPGNRLESLVGDRAGQHSIRINDQFRICFTWTPSGPADVEITDYH